MKQTKKRAIQAADLEQLSEINLDAAGIDIGDSEIYVAVPSGRSAESVRCFGTFTADLHQLVAWLTHYSTFTPAIDVEQNPLPPPRRPTRHPLAFDLRTQLYRLTGVDLTQIDGIDSLTAQTIIAEIGTDMSPWPTARHFASWLGLCPNNLVSGGKVLKRTSRKVVNPAATALRQAAQSLSRSQSALGAFYRRMRTSHGPQVANKATAHKLTRIIYHLLKKSQPYLAPSADIYELQYRQRLVRNLQRQAQKLGFALHPTPDQAASVS